ncbi:hypothetical protein TB1_007825 [Malus domestica]
MTMETARVVEQGRHQRVVSRVGHASSSSKVRYQVKQGIRKRKWSRKIQHPLSLAPPSTVPTPLQHLFDACRHVFKGHGTVPLPHHVHKLCRILDDMTPEDIGLSRNLQFFKPKAVVKGTPRVTYTTIYECNKFSLCCFFIPANGVIPLHNHPDMTVFSKLLLGNMHIKSYDWVDPVNSDGSTPAPQLRLAELKADSVFTAPCNASVLYPTKGGNIHAFTAITPCAVLDVIGPPYSKEDGRDCSYYKDHPYAAYSNGGAAVTEEKRDCYGWLEEIEMPENAEMDIIEYLGPQVSETSS